jgi:hypothetical protein
LPACPIFESEFSEKEGGGFEETHGASNIESRRTFSINLRRPLAPVPFVTVFFAIAFKAGVVNLWERERVQSVSSTLSGEP